MAYPGTLSSFRVSSNGTWRRCGTLSLDLPCDGGSILRANRQLQAKKHVLNGVHAEANIMRVVLLILGADYMRHVR